MSENIGRPIATESPSGGRANQHSTGSVPTRFGNAALYARVSTAGQEKEETVKSQIEEIFTHAQKKGYPLREQSFFVDEGYSGSVLVRPALDKLRDLVAEGVYDLVLIHDPDRLARNYAHQMVLLEEFQKQGCAVIFIRNPLGDSPDERLLVQVQSVVAEYERAKIAERTRRGKIYRMRSGELVSGRRTFGYKYIKKNSDEPARYEIIEEEAETVRDIYSWLVDEGLSLRRIALRLNENGMRSARGGHWRGTNIGVLVKNPIYTGTGYANKTKSVEPRNDSGSRTVYRKHAKTRTVRRDKDEWIPFDAPRIISDETYELALERLKSNIKLSPRRTKSEYLLRGLIRCKCCGKSAMGHKGTYTCPYARPSAAKTYGVEICENKPRIKTNELDDKVWLEVKKLVKSPTKLKRIHQRLREKPVLKAIGNRENLKNKEQSVVGKIQRINDLYIDGHIDKEQHAKKTSKAKVELDSVRGKLKKLEEENIVNNELKTMISSFAKFSETIRSGLDNADFNMKKYIVNYIVKKVEFGPDEVVLHYAVPFKRNAKIGTMCIANRDSTAQGKALGS